MLIYWGAVHTVMTNRVTLLSDIKESGLDVKAYISKYIFMYCDQNAGQKHGTNNGNSSFAILK
jgi:hypothetical protein